MINKSKCLNHPILSTRLHPHAHVRPKPLWLIIIIKLSNLLIAMHRDHGSPP